MGSSDSGRPEVVLIECRNDTSQWELHDGPSSAGMAELLNEATRDRFLTVRWNNIITLSLGLLTLVFALVALSPDTFSDRAAFIGLVVLGAFY